MHDPDVVDGKALYGVGCDLFQRALGQDRMMLEHEPLDWRPSGRQWPGQPNEADDGSLNNGSAYDSLKLGSRIESAMIEAGDDAHSAPGHGSQELDLVLSAQCVVIANDGVPNDRPDALVLQCVGDLRVGRDKMSPQAGHAAGAFDGHFESWPKRTRQLAVKEHSHSRSIDCAPGMGSLAVLGLGSSPTNRG
jgi:hypothetical protein